MPLACLLKRRGGASRRHALALLPALCAVLLGGASLPALAAWPEKPVNVIISFPPAGATDVLARAVGAALADELKQSVLVQNRPGAGGAIGLQAAAKAAPDGYTFYLAAISNQAIAASVYANQPASLVEDFVPVAGVGAVPHALVVPASLPVKDVAGLVAYLKQSPGQYNFASQGTGTLSHLESELFAIKTGTSLAHIPYKGSSQALPELAAGSSALMFDSIPGSMPLVQAGKLRFLAVASSRRMAMLPDVPTVAEAGVPGFEADNWFGFSAPKGMPAEAVERFGAAVRKVLERPALREQLVKQGVELRYLAPPELDRLIRREHQVWGEVVRSAKVQAQ